MAIFIPQYGTAYFIFYSVAQIWEYTLLNSGDMRGTDMKYSRAVLLFSGLEVIQSGRGKHAR